MILTGPLGKTVVRELELILELTLIKLLTIQALVLLINLPGKKYDTHEDE